MITFKVDESKTFTRALEKAQKVSDDLSAPFSLIAQDFYRTQPATWNQSGAGVYQDLTERTKKQKRAQVGFVYPILRRNGYLERAASEEGAQGNITEVTANSLTLGVDDRSIPYAGYQQLGTTFIPARPYIFGPGSPYAVGPQQGRLDRWLKIIQEFILLKLQESKLGDVA